MWTSTGIGHPQALAALYMIPRGNGVARQLDALAGKQVSTMQEARHMLMLQPNYSVSARSQILAVTLAQAPRCNNTFLATISQQLRSGAAVRRRRGQLADDLQLICVRRLCRRWRRLQRRKDCRHLAALRRHLERLRFNVRHLQPGLHLDPVLAFTRLGPSTSQA